MKRLILFVFCIFFLVACKHLDPVDGPNNPKLIKADNVLLYGFEPRYTSMEFLANYLESLLRVDHPNVKVEYKKTSGMMLKESIYNPAYREDSLTALKSKKYDYVVISDHAFKSFSYPEYHYIGVSEVSKIARKNGSIPMLLNHDDGGEVPSYSSSDSYYEGYDYNYNNERPLNRSRFKEISYRVARGTSSKIIPAADIIFNTTNDMKSRSLATSAAIYTKITGKNAADLDLDMEVFSDDEYNLLTSQSYTTVQEEKKKIHYTGPYSGRVQISKNPFPKPGDKFNFFWMGTSSEQYKMNNLITLLDSSGYSVNTVKSNRVGWGPDSRIANERLSKILMKKFNERSERYLFAFARSWLTDAEPSILKQNKIDPIIYRKHYPGSGDIHLSLKNKYHLFGLFEYKKAIELSLFFLPFSTGVARYHYKHPNVKFGKDSHVSTTYNYIAASMLYTTVTGEMASTKKLVANSKNSASLEAVVDAVKVGHETLRQMIHLSDSGYFVADYIEE